MKETFNELIAYLKNPVLEQDANTDIQYRLKKFLHLLIISIITASLFSGVFILIEELGLIDLENHEVKKMFENFSAPMILFLTVIMAPLLEEVFFRAPLTLFKTKESFKILFYVFAVLFGLVHISNFEMSTNVLLLAPILIAPQTILGGFLGFIRVRFGLIWSILLHATYNFFFIGLTLLGEHLS